MSKIVLCVDNHNSHLKDTIEFLASKQCKVYTMEGLNENVLKDIINEIQQKEGRLDLLLLTANEQLPEDNPIGKGHNDKQLLKLLDQQISGAQAVLEAALPLLEKSDFKRIGMITNSDSSNSLCQSDKNFVQHMTLAGLNMLGKIYFNRLRPDGFTFRWYCATPESGGLSAGEYLLTNLCYDPKEPYQHSDENRFVMRDHNLREIPW